MDNLSQKPIAKKGVWSPYVLAACAVFFSLFPAMVLFAINYGRYGFPKKRTRWLWITAATFPIFVVTNLLSPDWAPHRMLLLTAVGIWVMYSNQIALYQNWKLEQRRTASPWHALWIALACAMLQLGLYFLPLGQDDYLAYDLLTEENYPAAELVLKQSRIDYPDDLDVRFNLALVYFNTARLELARQELTEMLRLDPENTPAMAFLAELESNPKD